MKLKTKRAAQSVSLFIIVLLAVSCNEVSQKSISENQKVTKHTDTVVIKQMQFVPAILNIAKGDTVVWLNQDLVDHDITSDANGLFYSDTLKVGNSWKYMVTDSASYHCSIHPSMKGQIIFK
ncbi:MAG: plastocyanin [Bacteroidetes bacterium]|nr:plastocyanin [Bacteroidota bacterium]